MKKYIILTTWLAISACTPAQRAAVETGWEAYTIIIPTEKEMTK